MKVFSPFLNGNTTTSGSFNVPNHPSTASIQNPLTGSLFHDDTDGILKIYTGTQWQVVGEQAVLPPSIEVEYLLVAGGGAGGGGTYNSGGGGAGGLLSSSLASVQSGSSFTVTVGAGGTGAATQGNEGTNSTIAGSTITTITSIGGGGGGSHSDNPYSGTDGGSGGGGTQGTGAGGSGTVGQGNNGTGLWYGTGGGGGGAGESGSVGFGNVDPYPRGSQSDIDGGDGLQTNITGTPTYFAGGGGGGERVALSVVRGNGGAGGGGQGGPDAGAGSAGTSNTGGGGGGSGGNNTSTRSGGSGGSGVAIFAYDSGSINAAGGIVGDAGNGRKYHQFNASSTLKIGNTTTDFVIPSSILDKAVIHVDAGNFASRGTSTWTDLKGNANGTVGGATLGNNFYYDFDGSNDYIDFGDNSATSRTGAFGFDLWIKMDSGHAGSSPVHKESQFSIDINPSMDIRYADSSVWSYATFGSTASGVSTDTWFHWAVTKNSSNVVTMWINGVSKVSKSFGSAITDNANELYLGTYDNSSAFLNGKIAQFRLYNNSLTSTEVLQIYNATKTNFV